MKRATIGAIVGVSAAAVGVALISYAVGKSVESKTQTAQPNAATRVQEVGGVALLISGIGLALGSGVQALTGKGR